MHKYLITTLCLGAIFAFMGCRHVLDENDPRVIDANNRLRIDIKKLKDNNKQTQQDIANNNNEITYLVNKITAVEAEKTDSRVNISVARRQIKDFFTDLMQVSANSEDQLFDCLVGNAPIERQKSTSETRRPLLLIDCRNIVDVDSLLFCGGELFCKTPVEAQFCILRQSSKGNNAYIIETTSDPIKLPAGYNNVLFPRHKRLNARRGNLIGLYIKPNNQICYDDFGTGLSTDIVLKKIIPGETAIRLPSTLGLASSSNKPIGKAFSFRLYGSSYLK